MTDSYSGSFTYVLCYTQYSWRLKPELTAPGNVVVVVCECARQRDRECYCAEQTSVSLTKRGFVAQFLK